VAQLNFEFNEGTGGTTTDSANQLVAVLGAPLDPNFSAVPQSTTNTPSGASGDRAVSFNANNTASQAFLVVDDRSSPILAMATNAAFTMEAWVRRDTNSARTYEGIGGYGNSYKMGLGNNGQFVFTLFGIVDLYSGYTPPAGEWHHLAAAWQPGTGAALYRDGILITNIANTRVPNAYTTNFLTIGAERVTGTSLQGSIDRFRIHTGALTAADLDSDAKTPKAPLAATLVAYNFSETGAPYQNAAAAIRRPLPTANSCRW